MHGTSSLTQVLWEGAAVIRRNRFSKTPIMGGCCVRGIKIPALPELTERVAQLGPSHDLTSGEDFS